MSSLVRAFEAASYRSIARSLRSKLTRRDRAAALLASGWTLPASVLAGMLEQRSGLWPAGTRLLLGAPPALLLARTVLCGFVPALGFPSLPLSYLYIFALALDLLWLRAFFGPVALVHLVSETLMVAAILIPAQLFSRWTRDQRHLFARSALHPIFHAALLLGVLPATLAAFGAGGWAAPFRRTSFTNKLDLQLLLIPAVLLISSVGEFARRGHGTPMPADPPIRLVTSGAFSYVANPMQIGKLSVLIGWSLFWGSPWLLAVAGCGLSYSLFIASPREDRALAQRFPSLWAHYRQSVRRWWPHWKPYHPSLDSANPPARLHLDMACDPCSQLAAWLERQHPIGLLILPISESSQARMAYDSADGCDPEFGFAALARALEHIHLGWAFFAWMIRLPGIVSLAQLITDALDPRPANHCEISTRTRQASSIKPPAPIQSRHYPGRT